MNCRPGDIARIVGLRPALAMANDRLVRLTMDEPVLIDGQPHWRLVERVEITMLANGSRSGENFWIGEPVFFDQLPDKYLRPIRDPGDDAVDEVLQRIGSPNEVTAWI